MIVLQNMMLYSLTIVIIICIVSSLYKYGSMQYLVFKFVCCLDAWVITRRNVSGSRVDQMMLEQIRPLVISREVNK